MPQVADWLEKLGMPEYAQRFAANDIDTSVLRHLTDQDLKELGVSLGHRRKMLAAISEVATVTAPESKVFGPEPKPQDTAERRQVTVMFSDLCSTALSAQMDLEDFREIISAYQNCVAETVQRFGGFVAKYMGDGVLVYFGYPQAHEDDAERAVRAGLELVGAVSALKSTAPLQTRVGIATGLVVVGDLIGSGGGAGAPHRWRDSEPCGATAGDCRAERGGDRREHPKAARQSVRAGRPRAKGPQGHRRAGTGLIRCPR
jgi:SAM domain (Sterile alpha motif)/Adenylate and Guanylate cyclase catalytic domain